MKLAIISRAFESLFAAGSSVFALWLPGAFLIVVIHCAPIYAFTWYFSVIDDLSARISMSLLVTMLPLAELLSEPRHLKSRGEQFWLAGFFALVLILAASHEFQMAWFGVQRDYFTVHTPGWLAGLEIDAPRLVAAYWVDACSSLDDGLLDGSIGWQRQLA